MRRLFRRQQPLPPAAPAAAAADTPKVMPVPWGPPPLPPDPPREWVVAEAEKALEILLRTGSVFVEDHHVCFALAEALNERGLVTGGVDLPGSGSSFELVPEGPDPITGLPNLVATNSTALGLQGTPLVVVVADVRDFTAFARENPGQSDAALRGIGEQLVARVAAWSDAFVGMLREYGDEFVLLLPNASDADRRELVDWLTRTAFSHGLRLHADSANGDGNSNARNLIRQLNSDLSRRKLPRA